MDTILRQEHRALRIACAAMGAILLLSLNSNAQPADTPPPPADGAKNSANPHRERPRDRWRAMRDRPDGDHGPGDRKDADGFDDHDGGPGHPGDRPEPIRWEQLPDLEKHKIEKFMEEHIPRVYMELQKLKDRSVERYNRRMSHVAPEMKRIMDMMRTDPQRGELMLRERKVQVEIRMTAMQYHNATDDAKRQQLKARLVDLCTQAFECQTQRRQMEVKDLEARLSGLKSRVADSANMKASLIQTRVKDLIEHAPDLHPRGPGHAEDDDPGAPTPPDKPVHPAPKPD